MNIGSRFAKTNSRRLSTSSDTPFDVVVFGGNGFVGSNVCRKLVEMGKKVAAVNRSGCPKVKEPWMNQVSYISGDVFAPESWRSVLKGAGGVVASIGGFGSYEEMRRINGDSNLVVAEEAAAAGVARFVFVSASFPPFPASIPLRGYIEGKELVEAAARRLFPETHTLLKPSVIYGAQEGAHPLIAAIRSLGPIQNPLMTATPLQHLATLPVVGGVFLPWSPVEAVAAAAAAAAA
eukprot:CAMPEP_0172169458 /NCGR_PEP_ID=MMETSP1050-20130122/10713_1 /TAXON_ID=233186 /ORGANISM="Cryptomonas curvata, Strain CCAP979/52" /LENGTH=234 /DNA_ID=CAMNT_0012840511 /DNA_START=66 /DNA_END=767 /DNA_ORIENTATION=-